MRELILGENPQIQTFRYFYICLWYSTHMRIGVWVGEDWSSGNSGSASVSLSPTAAAAFNAFIISRRYSGPLVLHFIRESFEIFRSSPQSQGAPLACFWTAARNKKCRTLNEYARSSGASPLCFVATPTCISYSYVLRWDNNSIWRGD